MLASPVFLVSVFGIGCSFGFHLCQLVACRNHSFRKFYCLSGFRIGIIRQEIFLAVFASPVFLVSVLGAGCIFRFHLYQLMACRNHRFRKFYCLSRFRIGIIRQEILSAVFTSPVCLVSVLGAGRIFRFHLCQLVACRNHRFRKFYCLSRFRIGIIRQEILSAVFTSPVCLVSVLGAGRIFRFHLCQLVACRNHRFRKFYCLSRFRIGII